MEAYEHVRLNDQFTMMIGRIVRESVRLEQRTRYMFVVLTNGSSPQSRWPDSYARLYEASKQILSTWPDQHRGALAKESLIRAHAAQNLRNWVAHEAWMIDPTTEAGWRSHRWRERPDRLPDTISTTDLDDCMDKLQRSSVEIYAASVWLDDSFPKSGEAHERNLERTVRGHFDIIGGAEGGGGYKLR